MRTLHNEDELLITLGENDSHFIVYVPEGLAKSEENAKLKNLRWFNTKNSDHFLNMKFWILRDKELAEKLGIDTSNLGDLY